MATDNFTQVHNLVLRGKTPILTRYVGVWGFITSHVEGWKLTAEGIARELGVGRDFVNSALKSFEQANCLIRVRDRDARGRLGDAAWFVTDLAIQLQQLGITDEATVRASVLDAYQKWQSFRRSQPMLENPEQVLTSENPAADDARTPQTTLSEALKAGLPSSTPKSENPEQVLTCENASYPQAKTPDEEHFRRSEPKSGFPKLAEPTLGDPQPKKTKNKEDQLQQEDHSVRPSDTRAPDAATGSSTDERTEDAPDEERNDEDLAAVALELVPDRILAKVRGRTTQARKLRERVASALAAGYSRAAIENYLRDTIASARTATYVIRAFDDERLPDITPLTSYPDDTLAVVHEIWPAGGISTRGVAACSSCMDANPAARSNARFRMLRDDAGKLIRDQETGHPTPCPTCHPGHVRIAR
uniref:hypothetical protein n=1 Tax=Amycolatopsis sp. CA-082387 TaxID=3239918 RepID=UPI003F499F1B